MLDKLKSSQWEGTLTFKVRCSRLLCISLFLFKQLDRFCLSELYSIQGEKGCYLKCINKLVFLSCVSCQVKNLFIRWSMFYSIMSAVYYTLGSSKFFSSLLLLSFLKTFCFLSRVDRQDLTNNMLIIASLCLGISCLICIFKRKNCYCSIL